MGGGSDDQGRGLSIERGADGSLIIAAARSYGVHYSSVCLALNRKAIIEREKTMNISSVTSGSNVSYTAASTDTSSLEKQVTSLQADLKKVNDSKDDQATKDKKAQVIQQQIQQLQQEILKQKGKTGSNSANPSEEAVSTMAPKASIGQVANSDRTFDVRV